RVTDVMANGRKPVFELRTAQGKTITATGNHPFRTLNGWTNLEDLRTGDRVAAPRHLRIDSHASWPKHELVVLAGLLSEGNTCHPSTLYFYNNDAPPIDRSGVYAWAKKLGITHRPATQKGIPDEIFGLRDDELELFI